MTGILIKRGHWTGTQTCTKRRQYEDTQGKCLVKIKAEIGGMQVQAKGWQQTSRH